MSCAICPNELGRSSKLYCSNKCQGIDRWNKNKILIEQGVMTDRRVLKRYLTDKFGHKCSICGITDWLNQPLIMILDHIDGNSENSSLTNLRLVCSNCDSQLPTYKAKNSGNGRFNRRQRYAEGKSF